MSKKVKIFSLIVVISAIFIFVYYFSGSKKDETTTKESITSTNIPVGNITKEQSEFSKALSDIKSIVIDTSIFSNQAYKTLRDHPISLGTDILGRNNPFDPIGVEDSFIEEISSSEIQTLQPTKITNNSVDLGAQVTINGQNPGNVIFEYGISELFGQATQIIPVEKSGVVILKITKLIPDTTYFVRAILSQGANITPANTMTFKTNK